MTAILAFAAIQSREVLNRSTKNPCLLAGDDLKLFISFKRNVLARHCVVRCENDHPILRSRAGVARPQSLRWLSGQSGSALRNGAGAGQ
jgi:hypothetical protein